MESEVAARSAPTTAGVGKRRWEAEQNDAPRAAFQSHLSRRAILLDIRVRAPFRYAHREKIFEIARVNHRKIYRAFSP